MNMKKLNVALAIFVAAIMAGNAQSNSTNTVYSDIVGYQTKTISTGLNSVGLPLLKSDLVKTTATSVTTNSILLSGETNFGGKLNSAKSYYVEVYSGALKGDRFDVNVAGSIAAANAEVVLNASSGNNTFPVASISSNLNGQTVSIREHITLADLDSYLSVPAVGSSSLASADAVGFTESGALIFYSKKSDGTWKRSGNSTDFSTKIIPPGVGVFFKKVGSSVTLTQVGSVRENDFAYPLTAQLTLVTPGYPMDLKPTTLGVVPGAAATDWTGGTVASGDSISRVESGALIKYTLKPDGSINRSGNSTDFKNTSMFSSTEAQLIKRSKANADYLVGKPF